MAIVVLTVFAKKTQLSQATPLEPLESSRPGRRRAATRASIVPRRRRGDPVESRLQSLAEKKTGKAPQIIAFDLSQRRVWSDQEIAQTNLLYTPFLLAEIFTRDCARLYILTDDFYPKLSNHNSVRSKMSIFDDIVP